MDRAVSQGAALSQNEQGFTIHCSRFIIFTEGQGGEDPASLKLRRAGCLRHGG